MKMTKKALAVGLGATILLGGGALAAAAQNLPKTWHTGISVGQIIQDSWTSKGVSRTVFENCGVSGSGVSAGNVRWNVRHVGVLGATAYVGEVGAVCDSAYRWIDWNIGSYTGNQLVLAQSAYKLQTYITVQDR